MIIQLILIFVILLIIIKLFGEFRKGQINFQALVAWLVVWLAAILAITYPRLTVVVANRLGVGRGVDLVVYFSIIIIFYLLFRLLLRLEKIEREITKIIRELALWEDGKK
jgi:hypothetical protein